MLKFIFGRPASGKTHTLLHMIKQDALSNKNSVLIVPEQFSFESERAVLTTLGDELSSKVSVMSFNRLCDEISREIGGIAGRTLGDADKIIFMNKALKASHDSLKLWKRYAHSVTFAKTVLDAINEFKINAITAEELRTASKQTDNTSLRDKLNDIAVIYDNYNALLGEKYIDPVDLLTKLDASLEKYPFFKGKTVYFDSFKGFTGQQYRILEKIIYQADNVIMAFTFSPEKNEEYNIFYNIRRVIEKITSIAKKYAVKMDEPISLNESKFISDDMKALERLLSGEKIQPGLKAENITVCKAETVFDEAVFAARTIRRLVREQGFRYRDFVIIARDTEKYEEAVLSACKDNHVACYTDRRIALSAFPGAVAVEAAIKAISSYSQGDILHFHKTGLGTLDYNEISDLENYAYLWNINGEMWNEDWNMDAKGFVLESDNEKPTDQAELERLNGLRIKAITPINHFKAEFSGNASQMAAAIVNLLFECNASKKLSKMCENFSGSDRQYSSDVLKQSYDMYMKLLDSLVVCFGDASIKKKEFEDALQLAVSMSSVGSIPQMLDEVTFGAADRIRPSRPKIAFVLGANQGVFPKNVTSSGLFGCVERRKLIESGIEISDNSIQETIDENYLVYSNLCCASNRLYISYYEHEISGELSEKSAFVEEICELLNCNKVCEPQETLRVSDAPETSDSAYFEFCRRYNEKNNDASTIESALRGTSFDERILDFKNSLKTKERSIEPQTAKKLYGSHLDMSASKIDNFAHCRFSYFCKFGMKTKRLQPAEFDAMQRGTIVHYVLEQLIDKYGKNIASLSEEKVYEEVDFFINLYLDSVKGYRRVENARSQLIVSKISRSLKEVAYHIAREFAQSRFEPVSCELKIAKDGEVPSPTFPFDDGEVSIRGSIDRVDKYNGYIRIVDYKTGLKNFKLPDILFGLNLQMLIYLYTVTRASGIPDSNAAGILYMPSKRNLNGDSLTMNGLIAQNLDLVTAMEKENEGEYVPKLSITKKGTFRPNASYIEPDYFTDIFDYVEKYLRNVGKEILGGDISVNPVDGRDSAACIYCEYQAACGIENEACFKVPKLGKEEVFEKMKEGDNNGI